MWTGERQSTKMRIKYLEAALDQDIQYFDTEVRTSDVVFAINTDAVMVQDAISEKVRSKKRKRNQTLFSVIFLFRSKPPFTRLIEVNEWTWQLGNFIHYMATFVSGFVVGFTAVWQLALVTLAVVPLIAVIGGIYTTTIAKLTAKTQEALSEAGNIVEQVRGILCRTCFLMILESSLIWVSSILDLICRQLFKFELYLRSWANQEHCRGTPPH